VRRRSKAITMRGQAENATMAKYAAYLLGQADELFKGAANLDTAVRDIVYEGLARIVYAAYDTKSCAEGISDFDHVAYIQQRTYEWFRSREFVEWFCVGASTLFRTSPREFYRIGRAKAKSGKATILTAEKVG